MAIAAGALFLHKIRAEGRGPSGEGKRVWGLIWVCNCHLNCAGGYRGCAPLLQENRAEVRGTSGEEKPVRGFDLDDAIAV